MSRPPPTSTLFPYRRSSDLSFGPRPAASPGTDVLGDAIDHLVDGRRVVQPTLITALLNGDTNGRSEEHTSELQSRRDLVCRLLLEKKKKFTYWCNCAWLAIR